MSETEALLTENGWRKGFEGIDGYRFLGEPFDERPVEIISLYNTQTNTHTDWWRPIH